MAMAANTEADPHAIACMPESMMVGQEEKEGQNSPSQLVQAATQYPEELSFLASPECNPSLHHHLHRLGADSKKLNAKLLGHLIVIRHTLIHFFGGVVPGFWHMELQDQKILLDMILDICRDGLMFFFFVGLVTGQKRRGNQQVGRAG